MRTAMWLGGFWRLSAARGCGVCGLLLALMLPTARADSTFVWAVQISATVQVSPPQIRLSWEPDPYGANSYTIYRKAKEATAWGSPLVTLSGTATNYTDNTVAVGVTYEYQIIKAATLGYIGYGYIFSGINAPLTEDRGALILVVATNATASLSNELTRLQSDLIGDGWQVIRFNVSSNQTPASVRTLITNAYYTNLTSVNAVFLFGHVPVLQSGNLNYDGHLSRPMPADAYYGNVNNDWPTDPSTSPSFLPSDVKLMVGRVDLANMPGVGASTPWPNETELLRNYLNKDHNWRHKLIPVQRRALMANRFGDQNGLAYAAAGYRSFEPLVGPGNILEADIQDNAPPDQRWISLVSAGSYLWTYGCGGGQDTSISALGLHGAYNDVWSTDIVGQDAKAVFVMFFGSWFGNWDHPDNIIRSVLATPTMGLACCLVGEPHWFCHHMGLGETIGYSTRLSMNNSTLYQNQSNVFTRAVYIALMGDPTLRLDPVGPPGALSATTPTAGSVSLNWPASTDTIQGYHIYRATSAAGPFTRLTSSLQSGTSFADTGIPAGAYTYMVRAVKLQATPSGTYFNPSQGVFVTVTNGMPTDTTPPAVVVTAPANNALVSGTAITVSATATDNVAVASVQFRVDGNNLGTADTQAPYSITWNTMTNANGLHQLSAIALDTAGNQTTSAVVTVTVSNAPPPDTTPPTVVVTAPANNALVSGTAVTVSATATDNVAVANVQFRVDGNNLGTEDTQAPYNVTWNTTTNANGLHQLSAIARDMSGNQITSAVVTVTVSNAPPPDTTPPTVVVTAPANNALVSGTAVTVSATATDNVAVATVQFRLDGLNLGSADTQAPYSISWDATASTNGLHQLLAIARDTAGNQTTSAVVTVTVNNPPPPQPSLVGSFSNSVWLVQFASQNNGLYTLERSTNLTNWAAISASTPGNGTVLVLCDNNPPPTNGFYRVRAQAP